MNFEQFELWLFNNVVTYERSPLSKFLKVSTFSHFQIEYLTFVWQNRFVRYKKTTTSFMIVSFKQLILNLFWTLNLFWHFFDFSFKFDGN